MDSSHHYDFAIQKVDGETKIIKRRCIGDMEFIQQEIAIPDTVNTVSLCILMSECEYEFKAKIADWLHFGKASAKYLSSEAAGGFTGVMFGIYAVNTDNGRAKFSDFRYNAKSTDVA